MKKAEADRVFVVIPQWPNLSQIERTWFLNHPLGRTKEVEERGGTARPKAERSVYAYVRTKREFTFWHGDQIWPMPAGTVLEVLQPDQRDQQDLDRQLKLDGKRLAVVRWRGKARLLNSADVERVDRADFDRYRREHGTTEDGRSSDS